jgi:hypothetical protein
MRTSTLLDHIDSGHIARLVRPYERKHAAQKSFKKSLQHQAFTREL